MFEQRNDTFDQKFDFLLGEHNLKGVFSHLSYIHSSPTYFFTIPLIVTIFFYSF